MALSVNRKELDEFCDRLFRTLDGLGLLPMSIGPDTKPHEYEKFSRFLLGSIKRYNDVETGFREWESRVLRQENAQYRKKELYPVLEQLRQWLAANSKLLVENKVNLQHLLASLYARVFNYLYPRRVLALAYCVKHQGNSEAINREFLATALPNSVEQEVEKLRQTFMQEWDTIVADTKSAILANAQYYRSVLKGKREDTESIEPYQEILPTELTESEI